MICDPCKETPAPECEKKCTGLGVPGTATPPTCPCQHVPTTRFKDGTVAPAGVTGKDIFR